jgi:hypothetical protein
MHLERIDYQIDILLTIRYKTTPPDKSPGQQFITFEQALQLFILAALKYTLLQQCVVYFLVLTLDDDMHVLPEIANNESLAFTRWSHKPNT